MTQDQIRAILDRVLSLPPERQADAAEVLQRMEAQDKSACRLSDEQVTEVQRRRAERTRPCLPLTSSTIGSASAMAYEIVTSRRCGTAGLTGTGHRWTRRQGLAIVRAVSQTRIGG